jgi:hypothetical protein
MALAGDSAPDDIVQLAISNANSNHYYSNQPFGNSNHYYIIQQVQLSLLIGNANSNHYYSNHGSTIPINHLPIIIPC